MNTKKYLCSLRTLILMLLFTAAFPLTGFGAPLQGHVDEIHQENISGWAIDPQQPQENLIITVTIQNDAGKTLKVLNGTANKPRADVAASGYANEACGFTIPIDWSSFEDGKYQVVVNAGNQTLPGSRTYYKGSVPMRPLGVFKTTAYCPCYSCSEGWGKNTSTGAIAQASHTIAVDPRVIPYGSKVMINGTVYTAEDRGGSVKGNHIDIFFNTHGETYQHGVRYAEVFLIP